MDSPNAKEVDWAALNQKFSNRVEFVKKMILVVLDGQNSKPALLRKAGTEKNLKELQFLAHAIRGVCGGICANSIHEMAQHFEEMAKAGELKVFDDVETLALAVERLLSELQEALQTDFG